MNETHRAPAPVVLWIVWAAMLASLVLYAAMPLFFAGSGADDPAFERVMLIALSAVALVSGIGTLVARNLLIVQPARRGELDLRSAAGLAHFFPIAVVLWAVSESIGVCGLLLCFLFGKLAYLYSFLFAAAALLLVHAPRLASLVPVSTSDLAKPTIEIG